MIDTPVRLEYTQEEALVLMKFLERLNALKGHQREMVFAYQAEERVLWDAIAMLEEQIFTPGTGRKSYEEYLANVRLHVQDPV